MVKRLLAMENEVNRIFANPKITISSTTHTVSLRTRLLEYKLPEEDRHIPVTYR
jgi:hypothetical protein